MKIQIPKLPNVAITPKLHEVAHKHCRIIERARLTGELIACFFVGVETHYFAFTIVLVGWAIVDVLKLFDTEV